MYDLKLLSTDIFAENIYFIIDKTSQKTIILDPGQIPLDRIIGFIDSHRLVPIAILNTHAHPDHIARADDLMNYYNIPFFLHEEEKDFLDEFFNFGLMIGFKDFKMPEKVNYIKSGSFKFDEFVFDIFHTPGHTKGSICVLFDKQLISGDTLFCGSIGRTDLPGGSINEMNQSIAVLKELDEDIIVYPGHGEQTTIKNEKENNPYF